MLTKDRIDSIIFVNCTKWHMTESEVAELRRLALLGLEREESRARVAAGIEAETHVELSVLADSFGTFPDLGLGPDLDLGTEPHEAPCQDERDERAERIGRAVLDTGITDNEAAQRARDLRNAIGSLRLSSPAGGRTLEAELRMYEAIADALREEP